MDTTTFVWAKISNDNNKSNNTSNTTLDVCISCLSTTYLCRIWALFIDSTWVVLAQQGYFVLGSLAIQFLVCAPPQKKRKKKHIFLQFCDLVYVYIDGWICPEVVHIIGLQLIRFKSTSKYLTYLNNELENKSMLLKVTYDIVNNK